MGTTLILRESSALSVLETDALRALSGAVYPPEVLQTLPGLALEWAPRQWRVLALEDCGRAVSHSGIVLRDGLVDGRLARIGGIGGVMTHPDARRQGLAAQVVSRAIAFFREQAVDFGLLVCKQEIVPVYEAMGWRRFEGELRVTQHGEPTVFTFNLPMVLPVCDDAPTGGVIDLCGPPW